MRIMYSIEMIMAQVNNSKEAKTAIEVCMS